MFSIFWSNDHVSDRWCFLTTLLTISQKLIKDFISRKSWCEKKKKIKIKWLYHASRQHGGLLESFFSETLICHSVFIFLSSILHVSSCLHGILCFAVKRLQKCKQLDKCSRKFVTFTTVPQKIAEIEWRTCFVCVAISVSVQVEQVCDV